MKRARDDVDPWQERCYLGRVENTSRCLLEMCEKHTDTRTHAICEIESNKFGVLFTGYMRRCILPAPIHTFCDWRGAMEFVQERVERGSIPFDRSESSLFRPRAIENRARAVVAWIMCGKRMGLHKDVVRLIGCMVMKQEGGLKWWI